MSASRKKKAVLRTVILLLVLAAAGFGVRYLIKNKKPQPVKTVYAGMYTSSYFGNELTLSGSVRSDSSQTVKLEKDMVVEEVLVRKGDTVKAGDPLVKYDATLEGVDATLKSAELLQLEYDLMGYYSEYKDNARKAWENPLILGTPVPESIVPSPTPSPTPTPKPTKAPKVTATPKPTKAPKTTPAFDQTAASGRVRLPVQMDRARFAIRPAVRYEPEETLPSGTKALSAEAILHYLCLAHDVTAGGNKFTYTVTYYVTGDDKLTYTVKWTFQNPTAGSDIIKPTGPDVPQDPKEIKALDDEFSKILRLDGSTLSVGGIKSSFVDLTIKAIQKMNKPDKKAYTAKVSLNGIEDIIIHLRVSPPASYDPIGPTKAQREAAAKDLATKIREAELKYRQLQLDLVNYERTHRDGYILAGIDGVVTLTGDPKELTEGETLVSVKGSGGFFVNCCVSEFNLDKVPVGTKLTGMCYENGSQFTATVSEIATMPNSEFMTYGNSNISGYDVLCIIDDATGLEVGNYVDLMPAKEEGSTDDIWLYDGFISKENGESCIYVARNGVLKREVITRGKLMYGYVQLIGSTLKSNDYIAFPGAKGVADGAPCQTGEE